jgi:RimJ/RimL family protein N-acetyltransferase
MNCKIVPMAEEHIDGFRLALDRVSKERRYLTFLEAPPLVQVREFVLGNLRKGYPCLVAVFEERVVGWCDVLPVDRPTRAHCGVLGIALLPQFRGRGIGSALLRATIDEARRAGMTRIELSYRSGNPAAGALYERFGFVVEGRQRKAVRVDGEYEDLVCMALLLA